MAESFSNLTQLADYFRAQLGGHQGNITIDENILSPEILEFITTQFLQDNLKFNVSPDDIPTNPTTELAITGARTPATSTESFLDLIYKSVPVLTFTLVGPSNEVNFQFQVELDDWVFTDSYPILSTFAYLDDIPLKDPTFVFSTYKNESDIPSGGFQQAQGLKFDSDVGFTGENNPLAIVTDLVTDATGLEPEIYGMITQQSYGPEFNFKTKFIGTENITIAFIQFELPFVGIKAKYADNSSSDEELYQIYALEGPFDDDDVKALVSGALASAADDEMVLDPSYYIGTGISLKTTTTEVTLNVEMRFPDGNMKNVLIVVTPPEDDPESTSLGNLIDLMGSIAGLDELFASSYGRQFKETYLDTIAFKAFNAQYDFSSPSSPKLMYVMSEVGTLKPWPIWNADGNDITLDFNMTWNIISPTSGKSTELAGSSSITTANLTATVMYKDYQFAVSVQIPEFMVEAVYSGPPINLSLAEVAQQLFDSRFYVPADLSVSFTAFNFTIVPSKSFNFLITASATFSIFGTPILSIINTTLKVDQEKPENAEKSEITANIDGIIALGKIEFEVNAVLSTKADVDTVFKIHMVNQTVGSLLQYLINLVDPYFVLTFESPWNKILDISLDALVFEINVSKGSVNVSYKIDLDLGFITIKSIGLTYIKSSTNEKGEVTPSKTEIAIDCEFLGLSYGDGNGEPLAWDPMTQSPPAAQGGSKNVFELKYLGFGQHITPTDVPTTMVGILEAMQKAMVPTDDNANPLQLPGLKFAPESNWLIAAQFTVIDTVSIAAIFNDPDLYGIRISLAGEKAKSFAGLAFEILYKKVTPTIGLYHIELTLPDAMRNLQFGSVSITLPIITLDIYTNGNFRIDFGFPKGLDFSNSFSVQIFPFIGYAGFYFAYLTGATSDTVPKITNGQFNPVIEFGFGLSVGVGKTIEAGVLSAGISISLVGILEGTIAWFEPNQANVQSDTFYKISGLAALVGKLYGKVNFVVIQVDVEVDISASVTFVIEAYEPIFVTLTAKVTAKASIKILFVKIKFSFSMTLTFDFTIGSKGNPPWKIASGSQNGSADPQMLRHQRSQYSLRSIFAEYHHAPYRARVFRPNSNRGLPFNFTPASVAHLMGDGVETKPTLSMILMPAFTIAETTTLAAFADTEEASAQAVQCVLVPFIQNSISTEAETAAEVREVAEGAEGADFNQLIGRLLAWSIQAIPNRPPQDTSVTLADLQDLLDELSAEEFEETYFNYPSLSEFMDENFTVQLETRVDGKENTDLSATIFPIMPALTMTANGYVVDFATEPLMTAEYQDQIERYLEALQVQYEDQIEKNYQKKQNQKETQIYGLESVDDNETSGEISMSMMLFQHYFVMLARSATQAAIDYLKAYKYEVPLQNNKTPSIQEIADSFSNSDISYRVVSGDTLDSVATMFDVSVEQIKALNPDVASYTPDQPLPAGMILTIPIVVTPLGIVNANQSTENILKTGTGLPISNAKYQIKSGDSLVDIANKFSTATDFTQNLVTNNAAIPFFESGAALSLEQPVLNLEYTTQENDTLYLISSTYVVRIAGPNGYNPIQGLPQLIQEIMLANPEIATATTVLEPGLNVVIPTGDVENPTFDYYTRNADTVTRIAATWLVNSGIGTLDPTGILNGLYKLNSGLPTDHNEPLPVGTKLLIPTFSYAIREGDTTLSLMASFGISSETDFATLIEKNDGILGVGAVLTVPDFSYQIKSGDKLGAVAGNFNLTLSEFASEIANTLNVFVENAQLTIPHVPAMEVSTLIDNLIAAGDFNQSASTVSRFFLSGLRLPTPPVHSQSVIRALAELAAVTTGPLYEIDLQQISLPDNITKDYTITFTNTGGLPWLEFSLSTYMTTTSDESLDDISTAFLSDPADKADFESVMKQLNPDIGDWDKLPINTMLVFPGASSYLTVDGDTLDSIAGKFGVTVQEIKNLNPDLDSYQPTDPLTPGINVIMPVVNLFGLKQLVVQFSESQIALINKLKTTTFSPDITRLQRMPLYNETPHRYSLEKIIHWQTAALPPNTCLSSGAPTTGETTIWPFSGTLIGEIESLPEASLAFELMTARQENPNGPPTFDRVSCYMWGTEVSFKISTIADADESGSGQNSYLVVGADQNGRDQLQAVWDYINGEGAGQQIDLAILYPPNPTSANPNGLASDVLNTSETFLLKTNLSTLSQSGPSMARLDGDEPDCWTGVVPGDYDATIADAKDFIKLLWECSVVYSGGFYLNYVTSEGKALPDALFSDGSVAELTLLILISDPNSVAKVPHIHAIHNCAVVGDNIDASDTKVFVQPIVDVVVAGATLTSICNDFKNEYGYTTTPAKLGQANAEVEGLLQPGASMLGENSQHYVIQYGDTFEKLVPELAPTVAELATLNQDQPIFEPGALVQFIAGQLKQEAIVPPGNVGFEMIRPESMPPDVVGDNGSVQEIVENLFQLLGYNIEENSNFITSGEGLPVSPQDTSESGTDGLTFEAIGTEGQWNYTQTFPVYKFSQAAQAYPEPTETSAGLPIPDPALDPYLGIANGSEVDVDFTFQDVYGNQAIPNQAIPTLKIPVGYTDDVIGIDSWPSVGATYYFNAIGQTPYCIVELGLEVVNYIPSSDLLYDIAIQNAGSHGETFKQLYYQIAQRDLEFTLLTSLDQPSAMTPYPVDKRPFFAFASTIHVFLTAAGNLNPWMHPIASEQTLATIAGLYSTSVAKLGQANQERKVNEIFEGPTLTLPEYAYFKYNGTLNTLGVTADQIVQYSLDVVLNTDIDINAASHPRTYTPTSLDTLRSIGTEIHATVSGISTANPDKKLNAGLTLQYGEESVTTNDTSLSTLADIAEHFSTEEVKVPVAEIGLANQDVANLFDTNDDLQILDYVVQQNDTLRSLSDQYGFDPKSIVTENLDLPNLYPVGASLQTGETSYTIQTDDTLANIAYEQAITVDALSNANGAEALKTSGVIEIPAQVVIDSERPPSSTFPLDDGDKLSTIAQNYSGTTAAGLIELNPYTEYLFANNSQLIIDSITITVSKYDTFSTLYEKFVVQGYSGTFDQYAEAAATAIDGGDWIFRENALMLCPPMSLAANESLSDVAKLYRVNVLSLMQANQSLRGMLNPDGSITYENITIELNEDQTFVSVLAQLNAQWKAEGNTSTITLEDLASDNAIINDTALLNGDASPSQQLVPPPVILAPVGQQASSNQLAFDVPVTNEPVNPKVIFPLKVDLAMTRTDAAIIDPDFANAPAVSTAVSGITPKFSTNNSDPDQPSMTLTQFAEDFENAFDGLKIGTGQPSESDEDATAKQVWVVDFRESGLIFNIEKGQDPNEPNPNALYYSVPPMSTSLVGGTVNVQPYVSGKGLGPAEERTFQGVDLDVWTKTFLEAIDLFLEPSYAVSAYNLSKSYYECVVHSKGNIAEYIANRTTTVFSDEGTGDLGAAKEALEQRLLIKLSNAYKVDTIVQLPVSLSYEQRDPNTLPPRLSGQPAVVESTTASVGENESQASYGLSTAKVPAAYEPNTPAASTLNFLVDVKDKTKQKDLELDLSYVITEMEYDISNVADIEGYQGSNWLTFVIPIGSDQDQLLQSNATIGNVSIPIPLRSYPSMPSMEQQYGVPGPMPSPSESLQQKIDALKQWEYNITFEHNHAAQDTRYVQVTFPQPDVSLLKGAADPLEALFASLAQFNYIYPSLKNDLALLPLLTTGETNNVASVAVQTFAEVVYGVEQAWSNWTMLLEAKANNEPYYQYKLSDVTKANPNDPGDPTEELQLTIVDRYPADAPSFWPEITAQKYENGQYVSYKLEGPDAPPPGDTAEYTFPTGTTYEIPRYSFQFPPIDVTEDQQATADIWVTRNQNLGTDVNPAFVYETPKVGFANDYVPLLIQKESVDIRQAGDENPGQSIQNVLSYLLPESGTYLLSMTCRYGYELTAVSTNENGSNGKGLDALTSFVPVFHLPKFTLDVSDIGAFSSSLNTQLTNWNSTYNPSTNNGGYYFEISLYAGQSEDENSSNKPLLSLVNLVYPLSTSTKQGDGGSHRPVRNSS